MFSAAAAAAAEEVVGSKEEEEEEEKEEEEKKKQQKKKRQATCVTHTTLTFMSIFINHSVHVCGQAGGLAHFSLQISLTIN